MKRLNRNSKKQLSRFTGLITLIFFTYIIYFLIIPSVSCAADLLFEDQATLDTQLENEGVILNLEDIFYAQQAYYKEHGHYFPGLNQLTADLDDIYTNLGIDLDNKGGWDYIVGGYTEGFDLWLAEASKIEASEGKYRVFRLNPNGEITCSGMDCTGLSGDKDE